MSVKESSSLTSVCCARLSYPTFLLTVEIDLVSYETIL